MSAEQYAHQLDAIAQRVAWAPHGCQVWDTDRLEYETNPALPCVVCDVERILEMETRP